MHRILTYSILIALVTLGTAAAGRAQEGLTPLDTTFSDAELERRIRFIEQRLEARKRHGQIWHWSWLTINGGSMVGNSIAAGLTGDHDDRVKFTTSAVLGAIGTADILLRPLEARYGASRISGMPGATRDEKLAKLRAAESQLRDNAERASDRWSPIEHGANAGLALAAGLVVGFLGETGQGYITGVSTLLGGTANLLTQPAKPAEDWEDYKALTGGRTVRPEIQVSVTPLPDGAMLGFRLEW